MTNETVEVLDGVGDIFAGDRLLRRTRYRLEVTRAVTSGSGDSASKAVEGNIDITGIGEALVLAGADHLTLRLEDGRRLSFRLGSTGGRVHGTFEVQGLHAS